MEPAFTLMTSRVMKLARSEATKRMGPAISSAVAARPRGIAVEAIFWPALDSSTALDMSVATQPGATEFTRMLWRAGSGARALVRVVFPPFGGAAGGGGGSPPRPAGGREGGNFPAVFFFLFGKGKG